VQGQQGRIVCVMQHVVQAALLKVPQGHNASRAPHSKQRQPVACRV
jgi:hypothetical protein